MKSPLVTEFVEFLDKELDKEYVITSIYRPTDRDSEHYTGEAIDIACTTSRHRYNLVTLGIAFGCTRIGIYDRHIHFGFKQEKDQDVIWLGTSKPLNRTS